MKRLIGHIGPIGLIGLMLLLPALATGSGMSLSGGGPRLDSNCNQAKYFPLGTLCQDTDDGKLYKGTGAAVVEIAAGSSGDMDKAVYDADDNSKIDSGAVEGYHVQGTDQKLDDGGLNEVTAANAKDAVTKKHTAGTDQGLDTGGANASTAADVKDAVTKKHTAGTDQGLDTGGANASTAADVKDAVTKKHTQGTDQKLDDGGLNEVTAAQAKSAVTNSHANPATAPSSYVSISTGAADTGKGVLLDAAGKVDGTMLPSSAAPGSDKEITFNDSTALAGATNVAWDKTAKTFSFLDQAQIQYFYNATGADFERSFFKWDGNIFKIGTEKGGGGTARNLELVSATGQVIVPIGTASVPSILIFSPRETLLAALQNFTGTVVLVSHDRHFLRCLINRVFEIDHGEMRIYNGNYEYYLEKSGREHRAA